MAPHPSWLVNNAVQQDNGLACVGSHGLVITHMNNHEATLSMSQPSRFDLLVIRQCMGQGLGP